MLTLLGDIFNSLLNNAFNKSNLAMCDFFVVVNNNRSFIIALQYFLLCKQSKIALYMIAKLMEICSITIGTL